MLTINIDYDNGFPQYNSNVIHSDAWDYWKIFQKVNDGEIYSSFKILFILMEVRNPVGKGLYFGTKESTYYSKKYFQNSDAKI